MSYQIEYLMHLMGRAMAVVGFLTVNLLVFTFVSQIAAVIILVLGIVRLEQKRMDRAVDARMKELGHE